MANGVIEYRTFSGLRIERLEQRFHLLQIGRIETLSEPAVDGGKEIARLAPPPLLAPKVCKVPGDE